MDSNKETDILIIGGGIAGTITAYNILKATNKNLILIDCNLVGHGASGHNAGQLTTYFERPLADIASEFGVELTCNAQRDIESA
ncbi:MAG: FAD-dependent oxidoreductase [Cyanobium sp. MAG06]|nr:FAD-dependent oxidoreductase [Cyanobium sp. MAG06]